MDEAPSLPGSQSIAVTSDDEWQAFCGAIGNPRWTRGKKFRDMPRREHNQAKLEEFVAEWTRTYTPREVTEILRQGRSPLSSI